MVTGNLNKSNTKMIMANITLHNEMRTKVIYSFKSEIHQGSGEIMPYHKTLTSPPGMFTSLEEIQAYIEKCEQKRLHLDNEGKVTFKHVQISLVASNGPLMGCGPLPDLLTKNVYMS